MLEPYDRVLLVGGQAFLVYPYTPGPALPATTELLHLSPAATDVGRTHPVRLGLVGDPAATIEALLPLVRDRADGARAAARVDLLRAERTAAAARYEEAATSKYDTVPMAPIAAAHAVVSSLPPGTIVVDEAITTGTHVRGFHDGPYLFCRGGGLGWGMPAALGASLGRDKAPVVCVVGDGSAMYSPQALWTAAAEQLPVVFCVVNNRQYLILKNALRQRGGPSSTSGRFVGMDLAEPPVDFLALATSKYDTVPMAPIAAAHAVVSSLPAGTIVVDEAITTGTHVRGFHDGPYHFCRGGGLGWGMPAALGASLGTDRSPVVCVVGDGSAMYSPQALWTAAAEDLPVVFCVVNNRQYLILKNALRQRGGPTVATQRYVGMDLADPPVDFVALASSMGVPATMVEKATDVGDAVRSALSAGGPHLLELPIAAPA
jgi:thiamine pyrophosphate-dependent acetolactate synthase large subunit-like protein